MSLTKNGEKAKWIQVHVVERLSPTKIVLNSKPWIRYKIAHHQTQKNLSNPLCNCNCVYHTCYSKWIHAYVIYNSKLRMASKILVQINCIQCHVHNICDHQLKKSFSIAWFRGTKRTYIDTNWLFVGKPILGLAYLKPKTKLERKTRELGLVQV